MGIIPENKEAASAGTEATSKRKTLSKAYQSRLHLSSTALRDLRTVYGITPAVIVQELRKYYPRFDRTMLSKAENGEKWGVVISEEVIREVYAALVEISQFDLKRIDAHRLKNRVSVRLTDYDYAALVSMKEENGYETMQEFLTTMIRKVTKEGI